MNALILIAGIVGLAVAGYGLIALTGTREPTGFHRLAPEGDNPLKTVLSSVTIARPRSPIIFWLVAACKKSLILVSGSVNSSAHDRKRSAKAAWRP